MEKLIGLIRKLWHFVLRELVLRFLPRRKRVVFNFWLQKYENQLEPEQLFLDKFVRERENAILRLHDC